MPGQKGCLLRRRLVGIRASALRGGGILCLLALAAACAAVPGTEAGSAAVAAPAVAPAAPSDPLLAFVAGAAPGSRGVVEGQAVRVARAYTAASGRDCRELLIGAGIGERSAVACHDDTTGWSLTKPLLRGSGLGRP